MNSSVHSTSFVGKGVTLGEGVVVGPNCYIDGLVSLDSGVRIYAGVNILGNVRVGANTVVENGVCFSGIYENDELIEIGENVLIGAGSILSAGYTIGTNSFLAAGTIVDRAIPANAIVSGNPVRIDGYRQNNNPSEAGKRLAVKDESGIYESSVEGVTYHQFNLISDLRGDLSVGEFGDNIPFHPKRYFLVFDVPSAETRGEHAHKKCEQFLICSSGSVAIVVDDGVSREEIILDSPNKGVYIPPNIWGIQYKYTKNAVLLVFASDHYDSNDYIRDYDDFLNYRERIS